MAYTDTKMIYSMKKHEYVLTMSAGSEVGDLSSIYGDDEKAKSQLESISRTIYGFLYGCGAYSNRIYIQYLIATLDSCRDVIYEAMMAQLRADVSSGINDLKYQNGVNIENGNAISQDTLYSQTLCAEAKNILLNGDGFVNLCFAGRYPHNLTPNAYAEKGF